MPRLLYVLPLVLLFAYSNAQIPPGYYDPALGLTGENLKAALNNIIDGHTEFPYTSGGTDVWDILKQTDKDTANTSNVILLYSGQSVNAAQEYNSGAGWNREHVWAKSRGNFGTASGAGTDVHHLRPTDISVNSARSNRWFAECTEPYIDGGSGATGSYFSSTQWFWKPRDEVKGDVARMIFYMATRYEGENGELDLEVIDSIPANNNTQEPIHAKLSDLLSWHMEDPVDAFEMNRNEVIYTYQNNRNPYIDHPEYVSEIWSVTTGTTEMDDALVKLNYHQASAIVSIRTKLDIHKVSIYNMQGQLLATTLSAKKIDISEYKAGIYILDIKTEKGTFKKKLRLLK